MQASFDNRLCSATARRHLELATKKKEMEPYSPGITSWVVEHADNAMMAMASRRYPNLKLVDISKSKQVNDKGLVALARACTKLEKVVLNDCDNVTIEGIVALGKLRPKLQMLSVVDCQFMTGFGLSSFMEKCVDLVGLCLSGCRIDDSGVMGFASSYPPKLELVDLSNCRQVGDDGVAALASYCPNLKHIDVRGTRITNTGVVQVASKCAGLRIFNAARCMQVSDVGIKALADGCSQLTHLDLTCTGLTDEGLKYIGRKCTWLYTLKMSECSMLTDAGIEAVLSGCCLKLAILDLSSTSVTDKALEHMGRKCSELAVLDLSCCSNVTDDGIQAIALGCCKLHSVKLSSTSVTDLGVDALISKCPNLMCVKLDGCKHVSDKFKQMNLATYKLRL